MPRAVSTAAILPEEEPRAVESAERIATPERVESAVEKTLSGGSPENVARIFRGRADEEKQALARLGELESDETEAVPEEAARVAQLTERTRQKIDQVTSTALDEVRALLGTPPAPANENATAEPETVEAPRSEAVQVMPTVKVGEIAPTEQEAPVEKPEEVLETDEQRDVAAEVIKENYEALAGFAHEHGLSLNEEAFQIAENDLTKLTKPERMYAQVLMGKHAAGRASMLHAEKLLEAYELPEGDPKRIELMKEAQKLANEALVREKGAQVMQQNYMNLPEIMALAGGGGDETGGGYGGANFEAQASPFGGKPQGPEVGGSRGGGMYDVGGAPGTGLTEIKAYKTEGAKVEEPKPSWVDRFVGGNVGKIKDWFGQFGPDGKGRE